MRPGLGIQLKGLKKVFNSRTVLEDLSLTIQPGSFVSIAGPSGCGKSTLLRMIAGLEEPTAGDIKLETSGSGNFSFVFQEANLLPWRTIEDNVGLPFELQKEALTRTEKSARINEALHHVKLEDYKKSYPHELSGGMKMRVSLARALISRPRLLLMDEPLAALDESTRFAMQDLIRHIWQEEKMTILFVTHSIFEAVYLSERILLLKGGNTVFDETLQLPQTRQEELRSSVEYNQIARRISQGLRL